MRRPGYHSRAQPCPDLPCPPPPQPVRSPALAATGNPSPEPAEKKPSTELPLPSAPSPVRLQPGGRSRLAAAAGDGRRSAGSAHCGAAELAGLRSWQRSRPLSPSRASGTEPRCCCRHPGTPRHRRHGELAPSSAEQHRAARQPRRTLARRGGTGRGGAGTRLKGSPALPSRRRSLSPRCGRALLGM